MNPELKEKLLWASPLRVDGDPMGAFVRSAELVALSVGSILTLHTLGIDCAGPIAVGSFLWMGIQFGACERHETHRRDWRHRWNIRKDRYPDE